MSLPAWLQAHLEAIGADNPDGVTRAARASRCPRCRAIVLRGLDADVAAMPVTVDQAEVDEYGEYLARLAQRETFNLTRFGTRWELNYRGLSELRAERKHAVVAAHRCGAVLPPARRSWLPPKRTFTADLIDPPF